MKLALILTISVPLVASFQTGGISSQRRPATTTRLMSSTSSTTRHDFIVSSAATIIAGCVLSPQHAAARGRATLEQSYERYVPRIKAGGEFYGRDLKNLVGANDWSGIKKALADVPERTKEDLMKSDAGVAARARQAGGFSDARVLTAADLYAGSFSDNSITPKTKKMKAAIATVRTSVEGMQSVARQALGEEGGGGLFGLGKSKPNEVELEKKLREYYVAGGNAWNEYILAANDDLALKFDRLPFIK
ncbi:hypothetical protein MPSEU_000286100 [Mayamaea pseudoterrestris]|nr:hypothetical protein MPSEU_000286100 [Mayamaea pseudoterrestris]